LIFYRVLFDVPILERFLIVREIIQKFGKAEFLRPGRFDFGRGYREQQQQA